MNKTEYITALSEKLGKSKKETAEFVDGSIELTMDTVACGESINFTGYGVYSLKTRAARDGVNPKTGEKIRISESKLPHFKAGSEFKRKCNS